MLTRGRLGFLAFADAGRVFIAERSPGGWHTGWGGGLWYRTRDVAGTVVWGQGERGRVHLYLGLPF